MVDEEEVSEIQAASPLTTLPPELLMKILSYLSTYGRNFAIHFFGHLCQKVRPFQSKMYFFVKRSSFFAQLSKTIVAKSTLDLLRNVALVSKQFHKYTQVSISLILYTQLSCTQVALRRFSLLTFWMCNFLAKEYQRISCK